MAATIGPGRPAMAVSRAINGPPGLTMAAIIGQQRGGGGGGLTMAGADQLWQPQSVRLAVFNMYTQSIARLP